MVSNFCFNFEKCLASQMSGFWELSKSDEISNKSNHQGYCTVKMAMEWKNKSMKYDKVTGLLTRDFHPGKKTVLKCSNQNFFFPNHLFCSLLTLSSSASFSSAFVFLSLSHFLFPSPLFFTPSLFDLLQLSLALKSKPSSIIYPLQSSCFLHFST